MSLRGIVARFKTGAYTVTRRAGGTHGTDGRYTPGATSTFSTTGAFFPLLGRQLQLLPDGVRASDAREGFTEDELQCAPLAPDVVTIDGEQWGVVACSRWQDKAGSVYWRSVVSRQKRS